MSAILGIDAAWTSHHPSGVALIRRVNSAKWKSVRVSSSYEEFLGFPKPQSNDAARAKVPVEALLETARRFAETEVKLIVADIPLATKPISGRRYADDEISRLFGGRGCSAHSPSLTRPGHISEEIRHGFHRNGFPLATSLGNLSDHALIETYPHPALLFLMNAQYRLRYKVGKSTKYWPGLDQKERLAKIVENLKAIRAKLSVIEGIDFEVPEDTQGFSALKPVEDKIDALVCAWVGIQVLGGRAMAIGNDEASIWLPADLRNSVRPTDWSALLESSAAASEEFMKNVEDLPVQERSL
jgi:predicted RNase H-like nuclease